MGEELDPGYVGSMWDFFQKVVVVFWMEPGTRTIKDAILKAHRLEHGRLAQRAYGLLQVFPEAHEVIWEEGLFIGDTSDQPPGSLRQDLHLLRRFTSVHKVNEFLVSDTVLNRLREEYPVAMQAMETEEQRRGSESAA